jgi:hypothetical protein
VVRHPPRAPASLRPWKEPPVINGWVAGWALEPVYVEKTEISCPCEKLNPDRPVCSPSLYQLSYRHTVRLRCEIEMKFRCRKCQFLFLQCIFVCVFLFFAVFYNAQTCIHTYVSNIIVKISTYAKFRLRKTFRNDRLRKSGSFYTRFNNRAED